MTINYFKQTTFYFILFILVVGCTDSNVNNNQAGGVIENTEEIKKTEEPLTLVFEENEGVLYSYELVFTGENVKITYTFDNQDPIIENGKFIDGKIIINNCDYCYVLSENSFCVYNPETDGNDCYEYSKIKSTHTLDELNKKNTLNSNYQKSDDKLRDLVNEKISNKYFYNDENGLYTVIKFEPLDVGAPMGVMILSQLKCHYSFGYTIIGNKIETEYMESTCGNSSTNRTFFYDEANDYLYMNIEGQKFIFTDTP